MKGATDSWVRGGARGARRRSRVPGSEVLGLTKAGSREAQPLLAAAESGEGQRLSPAATQGSGGQGRVETLPRSSALSSALRAVTPL